jgi:hypothetical protein
VGVRALDLSRSGAPSRTCVIASERSNLREDLAPCSWDYCEVEVR